MRHKGGGHKRSIRNLEHSTNFQGIFLGVEHLPTGGGLIGRIFHPDTKKHTYILAAEGNQKGDIVKGGSQIEANLGNRLPLKDLPTGALLYNLHFRGTTQFLKAAGSYGQLIEKTETHARVKLKSGEHRIFPIDCYASFGTVSNEAKHLRALGKAGRNRWLGRRPTVRGVAMNPIDHPHGGGEGKTSGGRPSVTPWGRPTKGQPTSSSSHKWRVQARSKI
jgi:large subunit ribosomal protein L2